MLQTKEQAPDFSLPNQDGVLRRLSDYRGKKTVVLYFYPKDMTPGCTQEACDVRDAIATQRVPENIVIFGISADSTKRHQTFIEKERLNFDLLSDESHAMLEAYGVWGEKSFLGRKYQGISRDTVVVDPEGRITQIHRNAKVKGHIADVLSRIQLNF